MNSTPEHVRIAKRYNILRGVARDSWSAIRSHWAHLVLLPPMVIVFTAIHETAHALAVVLQGGTITKFQVWPSNGNWGYISYEFTASIHYSSVLISLAPYIMWFGCMLVVGISAILVRMWPWWLASSLFVWGYAGPFADIVNAWWPWLHGRDNDLMSAFGQPGVIGSVALVIAYPIAALAGYFIQKRLYRMRALSILTYAIFVIGFTCAGLLLM